MTTERDSSVAGAPVTFHATSVQLAGTGWTCALLVSETVPTDTTSVLPPLPPTHAVVSLSWPLAKALHQALSATIASYEKAEGEISLPLSFIKASALQLEAVAAQPKQAT